MILRRRQTRQPLPDALLSLAASLSDAASPDEALDRLTRGLSDYGVSCALFDQDAGGEGLRLLRSTLPLVAEVWGRPLRLPLLAAVAGRGRPLLLSNAEDALTEGAGNGSSNTLLSSPVKGTLIAAPVPRGRDRQGVLCLVSSDLQEGDRPAVWGLALQVGAASATREPPAPAVVESVSGAEDLSLFHELTRRLSYSLTDEEIVRTGIDLLAPLGFDAAAAIRHGGGEDATVVYAPPGATEEALGPVADGAVEAFARLTGGKHDGCFRPPFETVTLTGHGGDASRPAMSVLHAPIVSEGEVTGLLQIGAGRADAFDEAQQRIFYTVANQVSLALERVEAQRKAERAHLASLAESLSDGVVLIDSELRVTSANSAAQPLLDALTGESFPEGTTVVGTPLAELVEEALKAGRATELRDLTQTAGATGRRYLVGMAAPLAGSPEGSAAVVVLRDVTEERLMQERLLQSEKMVSVGQLVSGVAHELNNPLTGVMGFAQLLLARDLDERTRQDIETIYGEAERASKIVQNLLSFARRKRAQKEPADLNALLERVLELRNYDLRTRNIEVELDLDPDLPETMVDADQIQQVFLNIIINAEQAMLAAHARGTLTVSTRREGNIVRVSLQDDGPGMEPETLRRIFDPFFTTKPVGEGTGLGLTISYGIIEDHGGRIWAESRPGQGTTFHIELPVVAATGGAQGPAVEDPAPAVAARTILVVDDEESIQRLLGSILQMDGHHVETARNGLEALEKIGRQDFDVIITDIKMPDMDGRELFERLRQLDQSLADRTVFITGDTVSPETRQFLQGVENPCLAKPFRVREVRETIAAILSDE